VHELSIAQSLFDIVMEESLKHGVTNVRAIKLEVGAMAGVVPEALTFCFELVSRDSIAEGALIEIVPLPVVARCGECGFEFEVRDQIFRCPRCDVPVFDLVSGRELSIVNIEGETGEEDGSD